METSRSSFGKLHKCHDYIATKTRQFFRAIGLYIANKPWTTIVISLLVVFGLMSCILLGKWEVRYEYRDALRKSQSFKIYDEIIVQTFGNVYRNADVIVELSDDDTTTTNNNNNNILEKTNMLKALDVHMQIRNLLANGTNDKDGEYSVGFPDVCVRAYENGPCTFDSAFERLGLTYDDVVNMTQSEIDETFIAGASLPDLSLSLVVGGLEVVGDVEDSSGKVEVRAKSLRFKHFTSFPQDRNSNKIYNLIKGQSGRSRMANVLRWEGAFLEYLCSNQQDCPPRDDGLVITSIAERALFDELDRNASSSAPFMALSVIFITVIMWFMLGGKPFRNSRLGLGVGAVVTILLSMGAGFGVVSLLQIPLTDLSLILVFVVVGIGVDDVIVVVDFVKCQDRELPLEDRIANGLGRAGPTIFLTSFTNLIAFLVASIIDYPGVRWFCLAAGFILFILFILTVTLFTAFLTLDERRMEGNKFDCLCCKQYNSSSSEEEEGKDEGEDKQGDEVVHERDSLEDKQGDEVIQGKDFLGTVLYKRYLQLISNKVVAILIVCGFVSLIPIGFAFAVQNLAVGGKFEMYFPDESFYIKYTQTVQTKFVSLSSPATIIFQSFDASDPTVQDQIKSLLSDLDEEDFIIKPHASWLTDYEAYAYEHNNTISGEGYYDALESYLKITDTTCALRRESGECDRHIIPASYANDIVFSRNSNAIESVSVTRLNCMIAAYETSKEQIMFMDKHREKLTSSLKLYDLLKEDKVFVWNQLYMFYDRDKKMNILLTRTLAFAALAVLGTLLFFLHPISVLIIAVAIASIDGALFTVMYIWGIPIDVVAFLVLAMAIGLSVDYVVHVAHAFEHENGIPSVRLQNTLSGIGISVAKGGVSTFVGIIALAFAPSQIFRTFFQLMFSTVILGMYAGLVFFPACTVLIGHLIRPKGMDCRKTKIHSVEI